MEKTNLLTLVMILTVGIILGGSLLVPVLDDYTATTKEYQNLGMPFAAVDEDTHVIAVSTEGMTVDGKSVDYSLFPGNFSEYTIVYAENAFIRLLPNSKTIQVRANTSPNFSYSTEGTVVTITITETTAVVTTTASASTATVTDVTHYISTTGDYKLALNPVVKTDSELVGAGQTGFSAATWNLPADLTVRLAWSGDLENIDVNVITFIPNSYSSVVVSNVEVNTTDLKNGLYKIDSVLIHLTATDTDSNEYDVTATYTYFIGPDSLIYNNPVYIGDSNSELLNVIPILVFTALLVTAIGAILIRRND